MENMVGPTLTVLMPVYNAKRYLREAIESILSQAFEEFQFLIINDGSNDGSREIISSYHDSRICLIDNQENLGLISTLNKGLELAQGDLIARQDADDISLPNRFSSQVDIFKKDPECSFVTSNIQTIDGFGNPLAILKRDCEQDLLPWYLIFHNRIGAHSQVMFKKNVAHALGGYDKTQKYSEDYGLWSRFALSGKKMVTIPEVHLKYRIHQESVSMQKKQEQRIASLNISKGNIESLVKKTISLDDVECLRLFWQSLNNSRKFPDGRNATTVYSWLKQISGAYSEKYLSSYEKENLEERIDGLIEQQFIQWVKSPVSGKNLFKGKKTILAVSLRLNRKESVQSLLSFILALPAEVFSKAKSKFSLN